MASSSLPTNVKAICTVWPTIESFLDLEDISDITRLSATCKLLHSLLIDEKTENIKISQFGFNNDTASKKKTPRYILAAFNSIHFPSLRKLHLDFSAIRAGWAQRGDEYYVDEHDIKRQQETRVEAAGLCFPLFVANLAYAHNLESLYFHADATVEEEYAFSPYCHASLFQTFGKNLAKCKRLKELEVVNAYHHRLTNDQGQQYSDCSYSYALTSALTPALEGRKDTLQIFKLRVGGRQPTGFSFGPAILSMGETHNGEVWGYFLVALVSCTKLHSLDILATEWPANELLEISHDVPKLRSCQKPINLRELRLVLAPRGPINEFPDRTDFVPLVGHFSDCHSLQDITLVFDNVLWREEENLKQVECLLKNQTNLSSLEISFGSLMEDIGIEMIEDCVRRNLDRLGSLKINSLRNVEADRLFRLMDDLCDAGFAVIENSTRYEEEPRPEGVEYVNYLFMERLNQSANNGNELREKG